MPNSRYIVDVIYMHLHVAALHCYNICIVLQIDQYRYFITLFNNIHTLLGWMTDRRHIVDAIYTCTFSSLFLLILSELWPSGYDVGLVIWRPRCVGDSKYILLGQIFCNVHLFQVHRSWTGSVQTTSSMIFFRGNMCIEIRKILKWPRSKTFKGARTNFKVRCGSLPLDANA